MIYFGISNALKRTKEKALITTLAGITVAIVIPMIIKSYSPQLGDFCGYPGIILLLLVGLIHHGRKALLFDKAAEAFCTSPEYQEDIEFIRDNQALDIFNES